MGRKVRTTLLIDEEVLKVAKQIGINVSQFTENALREAIYKLKSHNSTSNIKSESNTAPFSLSSGSLSKRESEVEPRAGFGPATITLPR